MAGLFTPEERFLTPPRHVGIDESLPVIFLGGPIDGTSDFQTPLARRLIDATDDLFVASPRSPENPEEHGTHRRSFWHEAYIGRATFNGVASFWFAAREPDLPYDTDFIYGHAAVIDYVLAMNKREADPSVK